MAAHLQIHCYASTRASTVLYYTHRIRRHTEIEKKKKRREKDDLASYRDCSWFTSVMIAYLLKFEVNRIKKSYTLVKSMSYSVAAPLLLSYTSTTNVIFYSY